MWEKLFENNYLILIYCLWVSLINSIDIFKHQIYAQLYDKFQNYSGGQGPDLYSVEAQCQVQIN